MQLDRTRVQPGGTVTIDVTVHNGRTTQASYYAPCDGAVDMTAALPLPLEPVGESWAGAAAVLKADALNGSSVTGEATDQVAVAIYSVPCNTDHMVRTLSPGETLTSTFAWPAELVHGVPALPGDVPFNITLLGMPGYPSIFPWGAGVVVPTEWQLHVAGHIQIVGQAPDLLSKGQAVDAALSDPRFAKWLTEQPESTWSTINMDLESYGPTMIGSTTIVPAGPNWELDVFRGEGDARNFGTAYIDPFTGRVQLDICDTPCSR